MWKSGRLERSGSAAENAKSAEGRRRQRSDTEGTEAEEGTEIGRVPHLVPARRAGNRGARFRPVAKLARVSILHAQPTASAAAATANHPAAPQRMQRGRSATQGSKTRNHGFHGWARTPDLRKRSTWT